MATEGFSLAKTQKALVTQKVIDHSLPNVIIYKGTTTDNVATELFIQGKQGGTVAADEFRLYLPESSCLMFKAEVMAYSRTDDIIELVASYHGAVSNINGTVAAVEDYDLATGGTQAFVVDHDVATVRAGFNYNPNSVVVAITADDTNDYIKIAVTGRTSKTIDWMVHFRPLCYITETKNPTYGDSF